MDHLGRRPDPSGSFADPTRPTSPTDSPYLLATPMRNATDLLIDELARRQHAIVTRAQLVESGVPEGAVQRRAASGRLVRVHRGVYVVGPIAPDRAREMAAVLACGRGAVLSHRSAASLWGLARSADGSAPVDVTVAGGSNRRRRGILLHRVATLGPEERTRRDGIPITTPLRSLVDIAALVRTRELEQAVAHGEREGLVSAEELLAFARRHPRRMGIPRLREVLEAHGGPALTRSEAEARFLRLVRRARLPAPETNAPCGGFELDFFWRVEGIAVEVDGYRYHSSRSSFERDRRRGARLAALGVQVIPLTWKQIVDDEIATAVQLGQALARARAGASRQGRTGGRARRSRDRARPHR